MIDLSILCDRREKKPWEFDSLPVSVTPTTLETGDYTVAELCDYDEGNDTYLPNYAVERKGGQDFAKSITAERDRFKAEIKRASEWGAPFPVLIEEPRRTFKRKQGFMQYRDIPWSSISGTVEKWERFYNVEFSFEGTRHRAMQTAYNLLSKRLKARLLSG